MAFGWHDYLVLAEDLSKSSDEASARTAISRSYYFVYHIARQRLLDNNFVLLKGDNHRQVWEKFAQDADHRCQRLSFVGQMLRDKRNQADYDNPYRGRLLEEAAALIEKAKTLAQDLDRLDSHRPVNRGVKGQQ